MDGFCNNIKPENVQFSRYFKLENGFEPPDRVGMITNQLSFLK